MLWRRKSSTGIVLESLGAMLAACRIHGPLKIFVAPLRRRTLIGCVGERALYDTRGQKLRQNERLGRTGLRIVHHVDRHARAPEGGQRVALTLIAIPPPSLH